MTALKSSEFWKVVWASTDSHPVGAVSVGVVEFLEAVW